MVHGTALLVRYVLALKSPIDKYDHLMDIMKSCRHDLELIEGDSKILVFDGHWLNKRFTQLPGSDSVYHAAILMENGYNNAELTNFDSPRGSFEECEFAQKSRNLSGDVHGWYDVFFYSTCKFSLLEDLGRLDEDEWLRLQNKSKVDRYEVFGHKYINLRSSARLNHMFKNPEYLAEVKEREAALTAVPLTPAELSVLACVNKTPQLQDIIADSGFEMYTEMY